MDSYIIKNAKIWTGTPDRKTADTLVTEGRDIVFAGKEADASRFMNEDRIVIDAGGRLVIPSIIDAHTHINTVETGYYLVIQDQSSIESVFGEVKAYAEANTPEDVPFIYGRECPAEFFDENHADRYMLDRYCSDRPVLVCDSSYHRCLVNSRMLELLDPGTETGGVLGVGGYETDPAGNLTGIVNEHAYEKDLEKMYTAIGWRPESVRDGMILMPHLQEYATRGVGCVVDGFIPDEDMLVGIKKLEKAGLLHTYYYGNVLIKNYEDLERGIAQLKTWRAKYASDLIRIDTIKLFLDGTNEIGTSAVLEPYIPNEYGLENGQMSVTEDELYRIFLRLQEEHLNMQIHMVGDRAFRTALNAAERAKKETENKGEAFTPRINLLHCELTDPSDRKRPAELGIYINWTPQWAGGVFGENSKLFLGEDRFRQMYAFRDMIESGAVVGFSSDVVDVGEIDRINPFIGIQIGHTRMDPKIGRKIREGGRELLSVDELLYGYTHQNAEAIGDSRLGSIEPGKRACFCILDRDIFTCPAEEIGGARAVMTFFEGAPVTVNRSQKVEK